MVSVATGARLLSEWRSSLNLKQEEAAGLLGITASYLSYLENGKKSPGRKIANQIARVTEGRVPSGAWDLIPAARKRVS